MRPDKISESAESAEKSAESLLKNDANLSDRHKQILSMMDEGMAELVGLKGPRTRQLLNELVNLGQITATAATKNRRYIKKIR